MNLKFRRQFSIGNYVLDFYCPELRLAVEIDGVTHLNQEKIASDRRRTAWLNERYVHVVRFTDSEVFKNLERV